MLSAARSSTVRSWLLPTLLVIGAALFVAGVAAERNTGDVHIASTGHAESGEVGEHAETADGGEREAVLGFGVESTPLVVAAVATSMALAALTWRRSAVPLLVVTTLFALAFAVLDVAEVLHQLDESHTGIALLAALIALVHVAAAAVAAPRRPAAI